MFHKGYSYHVHLAEGIRSMYYTYYLFCIYVSSDIRTTCAVCLRASYPAQPPKKMNVLLLSGTPVCL